MEQGAEQTAAALRRERLVLFILAAVQFTTIVDFMIVMPLGPQLMDALNIGAAQFGLIVSSYTFAAGAVGLVASSVVDRFARRTAFMVLYCGFLLGTLLCAMAPTYVTLVCARVITGAFGGVLGGMTMTIIGDVFPEHRRGRATGTLMNGFALASVAGVPFGLYLGNNYGWHVPFWALVVGGLPTLALTPFALPPLNEHVNKTHAHPLRSLFQTFAHANHLKSFALVVALSLGSFSVFPYVSTYFVGNVGLTNEQLPLIYVVGGALTLVVAPVVGRLADRYGKLNVLCVAGPLAAIMLLAVTHLPPVGVVTAAAVFGGLMVSNVGRMIAAMAIVTSSAERRLRGGFMSAISSVQHIASGLGAYLGGEIVARIAIPGTDRFRLENFGATGWVAAAATLLSVWLASRVRLAVEPPVSAEKISLLAAAEATADVGEPVVNLMQDG